MTSRECFENEWFYMKYIGKYLSGEILLARECILQFLHFCIFKGKLQSVEQLL
jgi:hypothetical protein